MKSVTAPVGVALSHGFTGSLPSVVPWAEALRHEGFRVVTPLLPGHGTTWEDLATRTWHEWYDAYEAAYLELARECSTVVAAGLSMGGALALRLAALHPVAGVSVVNPGLVIDDPRSHVSAIIRYAMRSVPALGNDIKRPGQDEHAYNRVPVAAAHELKLLFRDTVALLPRATAPLQVFRSTVDHTVTSERSVAAIARHYGGGDIRLIRLRDSYHVATLDNDAETIFSRSAAFFHEVTGTDSDSEPVTAPVRTEEPA
ncbi:alpha/beta fold hydrolase [Sinomonas sp. JGH33]|uniref:Alpha/beta fold hydrolase n=1 Tax=Sinomonas terricola TaxID=3110330 RepID=A0ABU5TBG7_9MICC|nr:alpha/beta fold hydrolase [Sinomonas sp. JGH33]MEA5456867.1 alpha/beta fold hydrolase [Sinomonas sp. JGH33]